MIVVDTSSLMAVVLKESDRAVHLDALLSARKAVMSAGTVVEAASVYVGAFAHKATAARLYDDLATLRIEVVALTIDQARIAADARMQFGRGRHDAKFNFGDCFSYALAKSLDLPLLFKGNHFIHTDVARVI